MQWKIETQHPRIGAQGFHKVRHNHGILPKSMKSQPQFVTRTMLDITPGYVSYFECFSQAWIRDKLLKSTPFQYQVSRARAVTSGKFERLKIILRNAKR